MEHVSKATPADRIGCDRSRTFDWFDLCQPWLLLVLWVFSIDSDATTDFHRAYLWNLMFSFVSVVGAGSCKLWQWSLLFFLGFVFLLFQSLFNISGLLIPEKSPWSHTSHNSGASFCSNVYLFGQRPPPALCFVVSMMRPVEENPPASRQEICPQGFLSFNANVFLFRKGKTRWGLALLFISKKAFNNSHWSKMLSRCFTSQW